jgi:hypothetical protein
MVEKLLGIITMLYSNMEIRDFRIDGQGWSLINYNQGDTKGADGKPNNRRYYGSDKLFRVLIGLSDSALRPLNEKGLPQGKALLKTVNVEAQYVITGIRLLPSVVNAFKEEHKRLPQAGDRISFKSTLDALVPVCTSPSHKSFRAVHTDEADNVSSNVRDCVMELTTTSDVVITPGTPEMVAQGANTANEDVEELPW